MTFTQALVSISLGAALVGCPRARRAEPPAVRFSAWIRLPTGTLERQGPWESRKSAPAASVVFVRPDDSTLSLSSVVNALHGQPVRALSLRGQAGGLSDLTLLESLEGLQWLDLAQTDVTREDLARGLPRLRLKGLLLDDTHLDDAVVAVLAGAKSLEVLSLERTGLADEPLSGLSPLDLRELRLGGTRAAATALRVAGGMTNLRQLDLNNCPLPPRALAPLAALGALETLDLSRTPVDDDALAVLEPMTRLQVLSLSETAISDKGLAHLRSLEAITELDLSGTQVTDSGLVGIERATGLSALVLGSTRIGDATLARLAKLEGLRVLDVSETQVTDVGVASLAGLAGLEQLSLARLGVTDASASSLKQLTQLTVLDLERSAFTDDGLAQLRGLSALQELSLANTLVTSVSLPLLGTLPHLASLDLEAADLAEGGLAALSALPLRRLNLSGTRLPSGELAHLGAAPLESLDLSQLPYGDEVLPRVAAFSSLRVLKMNFTRVSRLGGDSLGLPPTLERFDAAGTRLSAPAVALLAGTHIRSLDLGLLPLTDADLAPLRQMLRLETLNLSETGATAAEVVALPASIRRLGAVGLPWGDEAVPALSRLAFLAQLDARRTAMTEQGVAPLRERGIQVQLR